MATYKAPLEDMRFVLNDVFEADKLWASMSATAEVTRDLSDAILDGKKVLEIRRGNHKKHIGKRIGLCFSGTSAMLAAAAWTASPEHRKKRECCWRGSR